MSKYPHVVIVGARFGGLGVAEQLAHVPVDVTLIDRHNYHTFQPLLYQVATSLLNAEDVGAPVRSMFRHQENVNSRLGRLQVRCAGRKIQVDDGEDNFRLPGACRRSDGQLFRHIPEQPNTHSHSTLL